MTKNTSLIITKEYSQAFENVIHFIVLDFYIIPVDSDFSQFHLIKNFCEPYASINNALNKIIVEFEKSNLELLDEKVDMIEKLSLIELLLKLNLKNFGLYHHSKLDYLHEYIYWCVFEDGIYEYYECENEDSIYNKLSENYNLDELH